MEVTVYEDPACSWCWAFQPVSTVFEYEFGGRIPIRRAMGGLRDRPPADCDFSAEQCRKAGEVFEMPFDCGIWRKRPLRSTFPACRAVVAASLMDPEAGRRLLRRLRESFHVEQVLIDDAETILLLAMGIGIDVEALGEHLASGRVDALFERDRAEASRHGFGLPTLVFRSGKTEKPLVLEGVVPYEDILAAIAACGLDIRERARFRDTPEGWQRLFSIHPRLTLAEIRTVAADLDSATIERRLAEMGARLRGFLFEAPGTSPTGSQERSGETSPDPEGLAAGASLSPDLCALVGGSRSAERVVASPSGEALREPAEGDVA
jgi:putative protein-disulfide isomerase